MTAVAAWVALPSASFGQELLPGDPFPSTGSSFGGSGLQPGGAMGFRPSGGSGISTPLAWDFGIASRLTWTDNGRLAPKGAEESDLILEVLPWARASVNGPRAQGSLTYAPRYIARDLNVGEGDGWRHRLDAFGNVFLIDENVGVTARASVAQVNTNPFGVVTFDPALNPGNQSTFKLFEVSPYARGRLGGSTQYLARYALTYTDDGVRPYDVTQHALSGQLTNLTSLYPFGWRVLAEERRVFYSGTGVDSDYYRTFASALGHYSVGPELRFGLGVSYARSDLLLSDDGKNSGWGPSASVEWFPTPRSSLVAAWSSTYYGDVAIARARHRAQNWVFDLDFSDRVQDSVSAGLVVIDPSQTAGGTGTAPSSDSLVQQLGAQGQPGQARTPLSFGSLNSALVRIRQLTGSIGYVEQRTTYTVRGFASEQDNDLNLAANVVGGNIPQDLRQLGADFRVTHRLDARTTVGGTVRLQRSESDALAADSTLTGFLIDAAYQLTRSAFISAGYRHTRQRGDAPAALGYDENAVYVGVSYLF